MSLAQVPCLRTLQQSGMNETPRGRKCIKTEKYWRDNSLSVCSTMRGCHSEQNVRLVKKKSLLFVSVIVPMKNKPRNPQSSPWSTERTRGTLLLQWGGSLFGLLKQQHRIKEWHNPFLEESGWVLCHFRKMRVMHQEWQIDRKENYVETS